VIDIQEQVVLAPYTSLGLGGPARYFITCHDEHQLAEAVTWARERALRVLILGGGSNLIVSDQGFDGAVIHLRMQSLQFEIDAGGATVTAEAGELWDEIVRAAVERGLAGIECLSGIPGSAGATPMQNVGAYGQEVSETIQSVETLEIATLQRRVFAAGECYFGYRQSRFRRRDAGRFIITRVIYRLVRQAHPIRIRYGELERHMRETAPEALRLTGRAALVAVRQAVLALRKKKSMVINEDDVHSRSAGSFFLNPVLTEHEFTLLEERWRSSGGGPAIPTFPAPGGRKVPAAWLVEQSGFACGYRLGGGGISAHHALALVNYGGTTAELLELAGEISRRVKQQFGIELEREPVLVE